MARTKGSRNLTPGTPGGKRGAAKVNGKPVKEGLREVRAATKAHARKAKTPTSKGRAKYVNPSNPTR